MFRTIAPPPKPSPSVFTASPCIAGLLAVLLTLGGCFFFRAKPDARAQELMSRLRPGLTPDEVFSLVGSPQRRGQNLFDKKREYWIYEFTSDQGRKKRARRAEGNGQEHVPESELQLVFERGKLLSWEHVPRK